MIISIGTDIIKIDRMNTKLSEKILSENEKKIYIKINSEKRKKEFLSGRFSLKESIIKAIGHSLIMKDISILNDEKGKPYLEKQSQEIIKLQDFNVHLSISHEKEYAVTFVIIEKQ
ncbi:holo-ACP synthase [Oceanotoga sp. DSM 15011]|jgi:phosphopantetheine--protein transferase-like protein|uniref:Holo-[acyl-carrier-protein] synthase n=1 Tax=Oceanotoga teriensis TaxID=515440 RepID=A0AA45C765_9BACT|nr:MULTISPECIES: holo-ACP synthase [Oceanotoga]MDN5341838.1 holo-[acyl-carrier protein] synthase [Oceanotoga sp.]MDO7976681.1 holo-ACP synthase [Oceanotoga teriensis]PWJ95202.1 holo-[acyl-carrier protein] synthase [Oceanotoga teriensis]UYP00671.1 holo-ACP synthase [Oceanotoga sp. DSM 15011]